MIDYTKPQRFVHGLLVSSLAALLLWAAEPWEKKPYTEWTQDEVAEILLRSPWARLVNTGASSSVLVNLPALSGPGIDVRIPDIFVVQWISALTVRQAKFRVAEWQGSVDEKEAAAAGLLTSPAEHMIVVYVPSTLTFRGLNEAKVRESAYLRLKRSNHKISSSSVQLVERDSRLVYAEFRFPRQIAGVPAIPGDEQKLTFSCDLSKRRVSADFDLRKMVRDGKPDL